VLGLGDDASFAAPAVQRAPREVDEAPRRATLGQALGCGGGELFGDDADQAVIAGEAEDVVDAVGFAPRHQLVPGEAGVCPQHDLNPRPAGADLADDPFDLGQGPGRGVDVRAPQLGREQMPPAEHVQRQITVAVVVTVEEPALLMAMQRLPARVGERGPNPALSGQFRRVEIEDDRLGRRPVRLEEESDEQTLDRRRVVADLGVARGLGRRVLEAVQRALAGERGAILALRLELAGEGCQHRVVPQLLVIDEILIAERNAEHPLRHHRLDAVLDLVGAPGRPPRSPLGASRRTRPSSKQAANLVIRPIARSVAPNSRPPASDVTSPPSKAATTWRPSTTS
jgi:hypothetical protein